MFRTLPIKTRLIISGVITVLAVTLLAGLGLFGLAQSDRGLKKQITATSAVRSEMMADMMHEGLEADVVRAVLMGPDGPSESRAALSTKIADDVRIFRESMDRLNALDLPEEVRQMTTATQPFIDDYLKTGEATAKVALVNQAAGLARLDDFGAKFDALEVKLGQLGDLIEANAEAASQSAENRDTTLKLVLVGVSLATSIAMIYSGWSLTRSISRPIDRLRAALRDVARGDFNVRIGAITRDDDIGAIARDIDLVSDRVKTALTEQTALRQEGERVISLLGAGLRNLSEGNLSQTIEEPFLAAYEPLRQNFNKTIDHLNALISRVVGSSESILARASEISRGSEDLATRTENQAATLEETAAALEEMTASVNTAAGNAKEVEKVVLRARNDVEASGKVVQGAVAAMNEIEKSSSQISQIIGVIDDIAFQTNLLALNAGVEAARAGEAGRGFAVVASEVRALAQRSSLAAKEIKVLIGTSTQHVHSGVQQVDGAGRALETVVSQVAQISQLVSTIASGSHEQALGLNEINVGVAQLDQVTQHNAAMVEESGAATQALKEEVVGMTHLVGQFVLRQAPGMSRDGSLADAQGFPEMRTLYARSA